MTTATTNADTQRASVLVVDDTPTNLSLMSDLLGDLYAVRVATGGARALKIARSDTPPDLILLDIMMPEMDGYEVCSLLKADERTRDIPVIFLTARTDTSDEQKGLELGAVDYITKPIPTCAKRSRSIWNAASSPTALPAPGAMTAGMTTWSPSPAKAVACAPRAAPGA